MTRRYSMLGRIAVATAFALLSAACDHPRVEQARTALGGWTQERMLADGWLKAEPQSADPVYCYRTLAGVDCHARPEPGERHRLTVPQPAIPW